LVKELTEEDGEGGRGFIIGGDGGCWGR